MMPCKRRAAQSRRCTSVSTARTTCYTDRYVGTIVLGPGWYLLIPFVLGSQDLQHSRILQVEINTIASSFGCLSTKLSRLHRFMVHKVLGRPSSHERWALPPNDAIRGLAKGLAVAHGEYVRQQGADARKGVVLMVVQPGERNLIDQKTLEVALWQGHGVVLVRASLEDVAKAGGLDMPRAALVLDGEREVSVAYFRAG
jgi:glutathione synthase